MSEAIALIAARLGLTVRPAAAADFGPIRAIARASFPGLPPDPRRRCWSHYTPTYPGRTPLGEIRVAAATTAGGHLVGYAYYQLRADGDVHLRELAAIPPPPVPRTPGAGALLLGFVLGEAVGLGLTGRATLNVVWPGRWPEAAAAAACPSPIGYYRRFGYQVREEPGYTVSGRPRHPADTWMVADPRDALSRVSDYFARRSGEGPG